MSRQKDNKLETPKTILGLYDLPEVDLENGWELDCWDDLENDLLGDFEIDLDDLFW